MISLSGPLLPHSIRMRRQVKREWRGAPVGVPCVAAGDQGGGSSGDAGFALRKRTSVTAPSGSGMIE